MNTHIEEQDHEFIKYHAKNCYKVYILKAEWYVKKTTKLTSNKEETRNRDDDVTLDVVG